MKEFISFNLHFFLTKHSTAEFTVYLNSYWVQTFIIVYFAHIHVRSL